MESLAIARNEPERPAKTETTRLIREGWWFYFLRGLEAVSTLATGHDAEVSSAGRLSLGATCR